MRPRSASPREYRKRTVNEPLQENHRQARSSAGSTFAAGALLVGLIAACGGSTPPAGTAKPSASSEGASGESGKRAAAGDKTLMEHREDYMRACTSKMSDAPDFCECGWEQMQKSFTEAELAAEEPAPDKLEAYKAR